MKTLAIEYIANALITLRKEAAELEVEYMNSDCQFSDIVAERRYEEISHTITELELLVCGQGQRSYEYLFNLTRK